MGGPGSGKRPHSFAKHKQVYYLITGGMKYREVAEQLGITLNQVGNHYQRALDAIIKGHWDPDKDTGETKC